jgi:metallo-beta-lactamase family protein
VDELADKLQEVVQTTIQRGGKVLMPAFSLGRAQVVVHYVRQWMAQGKLPRVPIYIDSPLAADIAEVHELYPENMAAHPLVPSRGKEELEEEAIPVRYIRAARDSKELSLRREACVLVASGGMCEAGRILNHLEYNLDDPRNSVVLVSYQAPGSLGRKLLERGPMVHFHGRRWNKWADVIDLNGFSGHADQQDLVNFFRPLVGEAPRVRLVHGELEQAEALAQSLRAEGIEEVVIPRREESVRVA